MVKRLADSYRPSSLSEVVGQFPTRVLKAVAMEPYPSCWLLEGAAGVGKTSSALALAADLGCTDELSGLHMTIASELSIDAARELFESSLRLRPFSGGQWHVLVIEELETLSPAASTYLKVALETRLPSHSIVVATSNGAGKLSKALLQRFSLLQYDGSKVFALACRDRLAEIWRQEFGHVPLPQGWEEWGWDGDSFSMRRSLDQLQAFALAQRAMEVAA
jgi:replication-associated recombination protein RarA